MAPKRPIALIALLLLSVGVSAATDTAEIACDVVIAGGSTASLAAAITAAEAAPELIVCYTEIIDWPGGQMISVPAWDMGSLNWMAENQPSSYRDLYHHLAGNPGACLVSLKCYEPNKLVQSWIIPRLARSTNLKLFLNTAVTDTNIDSTGKITSITAVQRSATQDYEPFSENLSKTLPDWYSAENSTRFTKRTLHLTGKVFVDATEFGDVLGASGVNFVQGVEVPNEDSWTVDSTCGQAWTYTYFMTILEQEPKDPPVVPQGSSEGIPFPSPWTEIDWLHTWTWRRSYYQNNASLYAVNVGDITQQNLLNDLDAAYLLLPLNIAKQQRPWQGGINLTALEMLEGRAYGSYHYMLQNVPADLQHVRSRLALSYATPGTRHGLSKMPYLRDSRRAIGMQNFRLMKSAFDYYNASNPGIGYRFNDSVAFGNYHDDTHEIQPDTCFPTYMKNAATKPFYIPLRALLVGNTTNLLVAGKLLSQTFHANGATRLHPAEWSTGVAAGGTAVLMARQGWTTSEAAERYADVQAFLNSSFVGQPLEWTPSHELPNTPQGYDCHLGRCIGVDIVSPPPPYLNATCDSSCAPLSSNEWLVVKADWLKTGLEQVMALRETRLKKGTADASMLPGREQRSVPAGTTCLLLEKATFANHYLCTMV